MIRIAALSLALAFSAAPALPQDSANTAALALAEAADDLAAAQGARDRVCLLYTSDAADE